MQANPGGDTRVETISLSGSLSGRTRPLSKTGLSIRDIKNLSMFLKETFFNFRYFFIPCKHINISGEQYSVSHKAITDVNTS